MDEVDIHVEAEINPTEDPEKVKRALENILGSAQFEIKPNMIVARAKGMNGLAKLYNLLRRERIRDAARSVLFDGLSKNSITFYLNKQVAYVGHISFSHPTAESPLGSIKIQIQCNNPHELIDWLAPKTT